MKLTVVTPSFNQGAYIEQTIKSILNQKGDFDLEYLIIDGGSTDSTIEILNKYNGLVKWVSEKDRGQSHAVNKGFSKAAGDIIGWLNSDDIYEEGAIQKVVSAFQKDSNCRWVIGKCYIIDENSKGIRSTVTQYKNKCLTKYDYDKLLRQNFISQPAVWFRKSFLNEVGLLDEKLHYTMDYDLWLRMGAKAAPVIINDYLASFRFYSGSKTGGELKKSLSEVRQLCRRYAKGKKSILLGNWLYRTKIRIGYAFMSYVGK